MKIVRPLLRVSSNQQLESDGDLTIQRKLVHEYIHAHPDWVLDSKEYFEGGISGYKNSMQDRSVLQEILQDAKQKTFDILVIYKDDRLGRLLWDTGIYVMELKKYNIDVYSVKDGRITPDSNDPLEQVFLAMRYGMAQKSSADTGLRVKDTAQKLVQSGKFMGGKAPYGYRLTLSGELSKHGRALHKLTIEPEEAKVVKYIYDISLNKEFGSAKIARLLNENTYYSQKSPSGYWKSGTITSILTNPVYCGYVAYKRREKINGHYHNLESKDWIRAEKPNPDIVIVDEDCWRRVQLNRQHRNKQFANPVKKENVTIIKKNDGQLPLIDVIHCGYCGCKLTNGTRYNYWTIKDTGEKKRSKYSAYKCRNERADIAHPKKNIFYPNQIEPIVFECIGCYIAILKNNDDITAIIQNINRQEHLELEKKNKQNIIELKNLQKNIEVMEKYIPQAMLGQYTLTLDELINAIRKQKEKATQLGQQITSLSEQIHSSQTGINAWKEHKEKIPTWKQVFLQSDTATKRVLVNKLVERIDVKADEIKVKFRIPLKEYLSISETDESSRTWNLLRQLLLEELSLE